MPGNRKLFRRAQHRWLQLAGSDQVSLPTYSGVTAIICSSFTDEPLDTLTGKSELELFQEEAREIARRLSRVHRRARVVLDATRADITMVVQDKSVSDIYVIGNGSLSTLLLGERVYYDWNDIAKSTTHLKLGRFVQRQCGGLTRVVNVPLGLFVVSDQRNVHAALDPAFYPRSLDDPVNGMVKPVFNSHCVDYATIKLLGSADDEPGRRDPHT
jgi:hypothetical protein